MTEPSEPSERVRLLFTRKGVKSIVLQIDSEGRLYRPQTNLEAQDQDPQEAEEQEQDDKGSKRVHTMWIPKHDSCMGAFVSNVHVYYQDDNIVGFGWTTRPLAPEDAAAPAPAPAAAGGGGGVVLLGQSRETAAVYVPTAQERPDLLALDFVLESATRRVKDIRAVWCPRDRHGQRGRPRTRAGTESDENEEKKQQQQQQQEQTAFDEVAPPNPLPIGVFDENGADNPSGHVHAHAGPSASSSSSPCPRCDRIRYGVMTIIGVCIVLGGLCLWRANRTSANSKDRVAGGGAGDGLLDRQQMNDRVRQIRDDVEWQNSRPTRWAH